MPSRSPALPVLLLVALTSPGCELASSLVSQSHVELPAEEAAAITADLAAHGVAIGDATGDQLLASARSVLAPLPVDAAWLTGETVAVVIGPLSGPVLEQLVGGLTSGGIAGLAGGAAAGGASLLMCALKLRDLRRRGKPKIPAATPAPVTP